MNQAIEAYLTRYAPLSAEDALRCLQEMRERGRVSHVFGRHQFRYAVAAAYYLGQRKWHEEHENEQSSR